jgi:hypothetical protein
LFGALGKAIDIFQTVFLKVFGVFTLSNLLSNGSFLSTGELFTGQFLLFDLLPENELSTPFLHGLVVFSLEHMLLQLVRFQLFNEFLKECVGCYEDILQLLLEPC